MNHWLVVCEVCVDFTTLMILWTIMKQRSRFEHQRQREIIIMSNSRTREILTSCVLNQLRIKSRGPDGKSKWPDGKRWQNRHKDVQPVTFLVITCHSVFDVFILKFKLITEEKKRNFKFYYLVGISALSPQLLLLLVWVLLHCCYHD